MNSIQDIYSILQFSLSPGMFVRNLVVAFICGFIISRIYCWSSRSSSNSRNFVNSLIAMAMITAVVILVIGNNLARAFGLVGAMSIIRFRTAVKDVQDIVFIFFSLRSGWPPGSYAVDRLYRHARHRIRILVVSRVQMHSDTNRNYFCSFHFFPPAIKMNRIIRFKQVLRCISSHEHQVYRCRRHLEVSFYIRPQNRIPRTVRPRVIEIPGMKTSMSFR